MSIQNNPRYKALIAAGMPAMSLYCSLGCREHKLFEAYPNLKKRWEVGVYLGDREVHMVSDRTPETAFNKFFSFAEREYGISHKQTNT